MSSGLNRIKLWCIGGGKGGIGKSIVTLGLGICLARLGKRVILIDGDLGGANLHTLMGIRYPQVTMEHFLLRKVSHLEETVIETHVDGLSLICGADDILGAANPTYAQKIRLLNQLQELPAQYILLDLGAGTSFNLLDFFNYSPGRIALFTSQTTSLQNVYGFIKSALYRKLSRDFAKNDKILELLYQTGGADSEDGAQTIHDLLNFLKSSDPENYAELAQVLENFNLFLIVNMVKGNADIRSGEIIQSVCQDFLHIHPEILGHVDYDSLVESAVSRMVPFPLLGDKKSKAVEGLEKIAARLVKEARLARGVGRAHREMELSGKNLIPQPFPGS